MDITTNDDIFYVCISVSVSESAIEDADAKNKK